MFERLGDFVSIGLGVLAMAYVAYEITRRRRQLHDVWDVLGGEDAEISAGLMDLVDSGELAPYAGEALFG